MVFVCQSKRDSEFGASAETTGVLNKVVYQRVRPQPVFIPISKNVIAQASILSRNWIPLWEVDYSARGGAAALTFGCSARN